MNAARQRSVGIAWHALPAGAVASLHVTDLELGLTDAEVAARRGILRRHTTLSSFTWQTLRGRSFEIMMSLLAIALAATFLFRAWIDSVAILGLLMLAAGCVLSAVRRKRRARVMIRRTKKCPAYVLRNGRLARMPASELVPGDIIVVTAGDIVPADARLFTAQSLSCVENWLTENSESVAKSIGSLATATPPDRQADMIFMGTQVVSGNGRAIVVATGAAAAISSFVSARRLA